MHFSRPRLRPCRADRSGDAARRCRWRMAPRANWSHPSPAARPRRCCASAPAIMSRCTSAACACGRTAPRVRCIGRTDDMLIVRGVNVFPSAVREVVNQFAPEVSGVILVRPRRQGRQAGAAAAGRRRAGRGRRGSADLADSDQRADPRGADLRGATSSWCRGASCRAANTSRSWSTDRTRHDRRRRMRKLQTQGVHHITLVGADRQTSIDFWEGVLGMPFVFEQPNLDKASESHLYFDPGDGRLITIFTDEERKPEPRRTPTEPGCVHHIAFSVSRVTFLQAVDRLDERGIKHTGAKDRGFMDFDLFQRSAGPADRARLLSFRAAARLHPCRRHAGGAQAPRHARRLQHRRSASRRCDRGAGRAAAGTLSRRPFAEESVLSTQQQEGRTTWPTSSSAS